MASTRCKLQRSLTPSSSIQTKIQPANSWFSVVNRCSKSNMIRCPKSSSTSVVLVLKCSSNSSPEQPTGGVGASGGGSNGGLKNVLSNIVDKRVEELLGKEENKALFDKLNKASQRVELAKQQLADIEAQQFQSQQMKMYINQLETRASQIAECEQEVVEARAMVEEAERLLSMSMDTDKSEERWESVKAASISGLVGTLAGLPIYLTNTNTTTAQLLFTLATTFLSCALFGVTFRYAVRRDLDNIQLKTGISAAFAFVKGLASLNAGTPLELNSASFTSHGLDGAFFVTQDLLIFTFAAVGLDFCFKTGVVNPFPIRKSE